MAYNAENQAKWDMFKRIVGPAWESRSFDGLDGLSVILGSDWGSRIPAPDTGAPRRVIAHAALLLERMTGYRDPEANYYLGGGESPGQEVKNPSPVAMSKPVDLQSVRDQREAARERAEIRRQGFATPNTTIQTLAFTIANEDWPALESLLANSDDTFLAVSDSGEDAPAGFESNGPDLYPDW